MKNDKIETRSFLERLAKDFIFRERIGDIENFKASYGFSDLRFLMKDLLSYKAKENGFDFWGLKFDNPSGMEICDRIFPECKFIHIIRDGRDVHLSAVKCLDEGFYTPYNNAIFWKRLINQRREYGRKLGKERYIEVKYESLLQKPQKTAKAISEFIGDRKFKYKDIDILASNYDKWKVGMSKKEIRIYEALAGDVLSDIDYERIFENAQITFVENIYSKLIENPLKVRRYMINIIQPDKRQKVVRLFKLFLKRHVKVF